MNVGVSVGDETLHSVEHPGAILFLSSLEHHALKVGSRIRLCQIHRHRFAGAYSRNIARLLILVGKFIDCLSAILQTPKILETGIGTAHDICGHDIRGDREIETSETAGHCHTHQAGLAGRLKILLRPLGIDHARILHFRTVMVNILGVLSHNVAANVAHDLEHTVVIVDCVLIIAGGIIIFIGLYEVALFQSHDLLHHRMVEIQLQGRIVGIEISHFDLSATWSSFCNI